MDFKSLFDSLDKATDILNVGRLIFYTAAGFCGVLPVSMSLCFLAQDLGKPKPYWEQFLSDLATCAGHYQIWLVALVFGFVIASVAYARTTFKLVPTTTIDKESYEYQYPRLFSGGIPDGKQGVPKDYAAWLVSEYYRYLEIIWYIPYALLLSLPVYALYSLTYLVRMIGRAEGSVLNAAHLAFALWTIFSVVAWYIVWPKFWLPRVIQPIYESWVSARRLAIAGLTDFINKPSVPSAPVSSVSDPSAPVLPIPSASTPSPTVPSPPNTSVPDPLKGK
jgi:hypothetical protein